MNFLSATRPATSKCDVCPVRENGICGAADRQALAELDRHSHLKNFERGQTIMSPEHNPPFVGIVVQGVVKLVNNRADGGESIVGLLYPSAFCGRLTTERLGFSCEAVTDAAICCIDRTVFDKLLAAQPAIEARLLKATMDELDWMRVWLALISGRTTMQRLTTFLAVMASRAGTSTGQETATRDGAYVKLILDRRDLAEVLGTTVETLSRNFQSLARQNIIEVKGSRLFRVIDQNRLICESGETGRTISRVAEGRPYIDPDSARPCGTSSTAADRDLEDVSDKRRVG
ncbi:Crp/Fnr family transcriptional regulator [Oricola nitratireducens]|uniref:Crp/Fnr family transcriptional regulator n=1 Tax=Oricola nitratireducens TaxID=2775868 RepID=UPI0018674396|nr:Crp/Fnr family transcriptional regulator [Oricola nitratireducens]